VKPRTTTEQRGPADAGPASAPGAGATDDESASTLPRRLSSVLASATAGAAGAADRLAHLVPGGRPRGRTVDATATYDEALRQAFRTAAPVAPARPTTRRAAETASPAVEGAPGSFAPEAAQAEPEAAQAEPEAAAPFWADPTRAGSGIAPEPGSAPGIAPGTPRTRIPGTPGTGPVAAIASGPTALEPRRSASATGIPVVPPAGDPSPVVPPAVPPAMSEAALHTGAGPSGASAPSVPSGAPEPTGPRKAGDTLSDDLLEVPGSVGAAADDFFGGLVRRVERRP
jgi:hypothetical protein